MKNFGVLVIILGVLFWSGVRLRPVTNLNRTGGTVGQNNPSPASKSSLQRSPGSVIPLSEKRIEAKQVWVTKSVFTLFNFRKSTLGRV